MPRRALALVTISMLAAGCSALKVPPPAPAEGATGRAFVEKACAGCHAVGSSDASRNPRAPAFRDLARRRTDAELMTALGEISTNGHVEMPPIYVTPDEMRAVAAYMRSLTAQTT